MKKIKFITFLTIIVGIISLNSCNDFLDKSPYASLSDDAIKNNSSDAGYALNGTYDFLQNYRYYGRNFVVFGDVATENIIMSPTNSGRFIAEAQWSVTPNNGDIEEFWAYAYKAIDQVNKLLNAISTMTVDDDVLFLKANALGLRALVHFDLVRMFAQTYNGNSSMLGVPYMKAPIVYDKPERATIEQNYTDIITDLTDAIELYEQVGSISSNSLAAKYGAPYYLNVWSTKAILAKVYMTQLNYTSANTVLEDIITNSGYRILTNAEYKEAWSRSYNNQTNVEFMFAIRNISDDYGATNCLGYIYLQAGYGDLRAPVNIYNLYSSNDIRKATFFMNGTGTQASWLFVNKFPGRDGTTALSDIPVIRLSDIYLQYAEAQCMAGIKTTAIEYLDQIRQRADSGAEATDSAISTEDLMTEIQLERRKELAYEGHYFFDLKRLKMSINSAFKQNYTNYTVIDYPNDLLAYPIPQTEMDSNGNMEPNPGYY